MLLFCGFQNRSKIFKIWKRTSEILTTPTIGSLSRILLFYDVKRKLRCIATPYSVRNGMYCSETIGCPSHFLLFMFPNNICCIANLMRFKESLRISLLNNWFSISNNEQRFVTRMRDKSLSGTLKLKLNSYFLI